MVQQSLGVICILRRAFTVTTFTREVSGPHFAIDGTPNVVNTHAHHSKFCNLTLKYVSQISRHHLKFHMTSPKTIDVPKQYDFTTQIQE